MAETIHPKNQALIDQVDSQFRRTYSPTYSWADVRSAFGMLTGLRGFWPMSTIDSAGNCIDHSGLGKTLTYNGNPLYLSTNKIFPYIYFDGVGDFLSRADEADLDILGTEAYVTAANRGLTMGGWFNFSNAYAAPESAMSKWGVAAGSMSYLLRRTAGNVMTFGVDLGGASSVSSVQTISSATWYFLVGRFDPSTEVAVFIDDTDKQINVAGIPANITNSGTAFQIGGANGITLMTGAATLSFLCAAYLPDSHIYSLYNISKALFGK